ncbi:MAG TPA: hypothetical protein VLG50_02920 [Candidatus Saccharimonadales bacterium]|nr:hypothetical protein [Candidatus Saccharimonadales bacterium]
MKNVKHIFLVSIMLWSGIVFASEISQANMRVQNCKEDLRVLIKHFETEIKQGPEKLTYDTLCAMYAHRAKELTSLYGKKVCKVARNELFIDECRRKIDEQTRTLKFPKDPQKRHIEVLRYRQEMDNLCKQYGNKIFFIAQELKK